MQQPQQLPPLPPLGRSASYSQLPAGGSGGVHAGSGMNLAAVQLAEQAAPLPPLPLQWSQLAVQQQQQQQHQQQQRALTDAFHPAWQPPEPAAAPSGHSQGSRLWAPPAQQPAPVVRPQPHAWPSWHAAVAVQAQPPQPAAAPTPVPADSAALTPTSADTRGIEVLLSAIEHEQQWEEVGQTGAAAAAAAAAGALSEEVAAPGEELARFGSDGASGSSTLASSSPPAQQQQQQQQPAQQQQQAAAGSRPISPTAAEAAARAAAGGAGELLSRLGASLRAAAAIAERERQSPSPRVAPAAAPALQPAATGAGQQARPASPGSVWQAAAAAAAAQHAQQQLRLPSPFAGSASPRAASPGGLQHNSKGALGAELSLQDMAARRASGTIPGEPAGQAPGRVWGGSRAAAS